VSPTQDMVLGCYYLTIERPGAQGEGKMFSGIDEAVMAYACGELHLQAKAFIRVSKEIDGVEYHKMLNTTVGRMIFNEAIPQDLGFVERTTPEQILDLEIDKLIDKKELGKIVDRCYRRYGASETSRVLDNIKRLGSNTRQRVASRSASRTSWCPRQSRCCLRRPIRRSKKSKTCSTTACSPTASARRWS
jgi:DNA-directed RNA polymerase subunit beta'